MALTMEALTVERVILVIEDNPDQARLITETLNENSANYQIVTIADGNQALNFLHRQDPYVQAPRPDLILLDLNLPGQDGKAILAEVKSNPKLKRIPIVVLTFSQEATDIFTAYALQGNCYVLKSADRDQLMQIVRRIEAFWLGVVTLPSE
jgi:two-component system, chemotaxis family, response regulator Rcp1